MPATSPPMGSSVPPTPEPGTPLSDPSALEGYFRAHFSELATEAKSQLDDAASSAPRVVEGAFRHAWEEREHLHTTEEVDAFLHEEVRHGAAREKSRRASLHRHDAHGTAAHSMTTHDPTVADVDQSWNHLARTLHFTHEANPAAAHDEVAAHLRHDAAGHVAEMAKKRSWKVPIAIGVVAALVVAGGIWYVDRLGDEGAITGALASPDARVHTAATAQLAIVTLDDGTRVELTPESKLIVPKQFGEMMRAVKLDGEATFTVPSGKTRSFEVRAAGTKTVVTGTVLTVRAFSGDSNVVVYLKEGSARLSRVGSSDTGRVITAGHALLVTKAGAMREPTAPELEEATSWNEHTLTIANRQLRDVLPQLRRWYGVDIKVLDLPLLDRPVTIQASLDSPKEAISAVEQSANVKFGYEEKTMVFRDAKASKPK